MKMLNKLYKCGVLGETTHHFEAELYQDHHKNQIQEDEQAFLEDAFQSGTPTFWNDPTKERTKRVWGREAVDVQLITILLNVELLSVGKHCLLLRGSPGLGFSRSS